MSQPVAPARFTLRQLPLPAKLVVTVFLLTVGVGYTSAMVQLHMQHSDRDGTALPTPENVVAVFAGKVKFVPNADGPPPPSRLEAIISGAEHGGLTGTNMTPAFFDQDDADYKTLVKADPLTDARRRGERDAVVEWIKSAPGTRQEAYDKNVFTLPKHLAGRPISDAYLNKAKPGTVLVKYILRDRCARCHTPGGEKGDVPLSTYEELAKYMPAAPAEPDANGYVDSGKQMSLEKLTQSTHAHLLSFAVLFGLTGLVFAFTSYPGVVRGVIGPIVLLAQAADVSCWWLARLPNVGPHFALAIMATGAVTGLGLGAQIVLSLFNMYGWTGKTVLAALFLAAGAGGGVAYVEVVAPYLQGLKDKAELKKAAEKQKAEEERKRINEGKNKPTAPPAPKTGPSPLERVLTGPFVKDGPWAKGNAVPDGGMVRAFFDKESEYKDALKDESPDLPALTRQREAEHEAFLAWVKAAPDVRKKAYQDDKFVLPAGHPDKPLTAEFVAATRAVKVKSLIESRCNTCHADGNKVNLDGYDKLEKYLSAGEK